MEIFLAKIYDVFIHNIITYFEGLDWYYMVTLILLVNFIGRLVPSTKLFRIKSISFRINGAYRVLIVGLLLALIYYFLNDIQSLEGADAKQQIKILLESLFTSMALYGSIGKYVFQFIDNKLENIKDQNET